MWKGAGAWRKRGMREGKSGRGELIARLGSAEPPWLRTGPFEPTICNKSGSASSTPRGEVMRSRARKITGVHLAAFAGISAVALAAAAFAAEYQMTVNRDRLVNAQSEPQNWLLMNGDYGFMYTTDGWGAVYKIDARNPNKGEFVWVCDPGVKHQGNAPRTRGIA